MNNLKLYLYFAILIILGQYKAVKEAIIMIKDIKYANEYKPPVSNGTSLKELTDTFYSVIKSSAFENYSNPITISDLDNGWMTYNINAFGDYFKKGDKWVKSKPGEYPPGWRKRHDNRN